MPTVSKTAEQTTIAKKVCIVATKMHKKTVKFNG